MWRCGDPHMGRLDLGCPGPVACKGKKRKKEKKKKEKEKKRKEKEKKHRVERKKKTREKKTNKQRREKVKRKRGERDSRGPCLLVDNIIGPTEGNGNCSLCF